MFKLVRESKDGNEILMKDMPPCSIAQITKLGAYHDMLVMRVGDTNTVVNLSNPGPRRVWSNISTNSLEVRLLEPGERITLEVVEGEE